MQKKVLIVDDSPSQVQLIKGLLEPGELSAQSLAQLKTIHTMALRINEIMQRFSHLATEMKSDETASQHETVEADPSPSRRR